MNSVIYDYQEMIDKDFFEIVDALLKSFIPFENNDINEILKEEYNFYEANELRNYFTEQVKCILRIYDSVEF